MARPLRIEYAGAVYHITSRGNEGKPIFMDNDDRLLFFDTLQRVNVRYNWLCHSYCLMDNHYHLVIETPDGNLSLGMRHLNGIYTQTFNRRHERAGHVFQGRFKAILIDKESHLAEVCRYVVLNPVRAGMVKRLEDWKWSSYRATAGTEAPHSCLTTDWIIGLFAKRREVAKRKYREFVLAGTAEESIWNKVQGQILLGSEGFRERFLDYLRGREDVKEIPKSQRLMGRPSLKQLWKGVKWEDREKRDELIRDAVQKYGYRLSEVAQHVKLHYSTVSRIASAKTARNKT